MDQTYEGEPITGSRGGPHRVGSPGWLGHFRPWSMIGMAALYMLFERSTSVCLGLPSWMYIDCNRHPPQIWIPLVALLLS
jgi:hypothetical protein